MVNQRLWNGENRPPATASRRSETGIPEHVPETNRQKLARDCYGAYESGDRRIVEELLSDDFTFYSPADPGIDRATYFERCWSNSKLIESFEFKRMIESGDEVIVTYEGTKADGKRFRNTEVLTFEGDKITKAEVYFGWDLE
jgi:ketosteroid isomerase-like protein